MVNMAYLAVVVANKVNGVAAIHSQIVKDETFNDFYKVFPSKFQNKTNGEWRGGACSILLSYLACPRCQDHCIDSAIEVL